jgi:hypothetical protein
VRGPTPAPHRHMPGMPTIELTDGERAALAAFRRDAIAAERYPMAPRWRPIKSALAKIDPQPEPAPLPPLKPAGEPSLYLQRKRGRRR